MSGGSLQVSGDGLGPVMPPTPEQRRRTARFTTACAIDGGWTDDLPGVLAALGLVEADSAPLDPLGRPYVPGRGPGRKRNDERNRA